MNTLAALMDPIHILGTVIFLVAILHTFSVKALEHLSHRFPKGSVKQRFFHLLAEVEIVFGFWAGVFLIALFFLEGPEAPIELLEHTHFTEPAFVFVIMTIASTRPILEITKKVISALARLIPMPRSLSYFLVAFTVGPLLGSFITEPAAMTVTALAIRDRYFTDKTSEKFKYAAIGLLFVNISIGGVLTHFAAPPVVMVAGTWGWGLKYMMTHFGWKSVIAVTLSTCLVLLRFHKEIRSAGHQEDAKTNIPGWLYLLHGVFLITVVLTAHHMVVFMGLFLFFIGLSTISTDYQHPLRIRESLLVGYFLGGLVVLGGQQKWWLELVLPHLEPLPLFLGATALTSVTDNAALTFLGSQVPNVSEAFQYSLVAGAVSGGGLTVIANAPNPAGFTLLRDRFGKDGISPLHLLIAAVPPTLIAMACFWFLHWR